MKVFMYIRQALARMREEKLFSTIYILGTALAIAFTMLITEIYYVKVADIAPEVNRSKTYYMEYMGRKNESDKVEVIRPDVFHDLFQTMQTPTCITAWMNFWGADEFYMKLADGLHDRQVNVKLTEPGFFRFFQFRFLQGAPFTQDDFDAHRPVVVVTEEVAKGANVAVGQTIIINHRPYRLIGVVQTPSVLTEECVADVWIPYTAEGIVEDWAADFHEIPLKVSFVVPYGQRDAFMQELKEVESRYNAVHGDRPVDMNAELKSHYAAVWQDLGTVFSAWGSNLTWYVAPAILLLLLVPALNLSGMVAARMQRRLPEMAVRKAFGAKRRTLLWQVIRENLTLTLIGGLLGLCLAWLALYAWRDWVFYIFSGIYGLSPVVPILRGEMFLVPAIFLIALVICCTLNVLAATLPAWLSLRKPIVEGMMNEEQGEGGGWRSKIWIAAELILVTFVLWWTLDPVLITSYVTHLPLGYDPDRLVNLEVARSVTRQEQHKDLYKSMQEAEVLLQKAQEMDGVEMAYTAHCTPMGFGVVVPGRSYFVDGDTITGWNWQFSPDSRMFEVYGFQSLTPSVPNSELTHDCVDGETVIITRSAAMGLFGTIDVAGRKIGGTKFGYKEETGNVEWIETEYRIRAVVEDMRYSSYDRDFSCIFECDNGYLPNAPIILRLREGVDAEQFIQSHQRQMETDLTMEHCFVRRMQSSREATAERDRRTGPDRRVRRNSLIAAFFASNLAFGVFGTLLMYTRQRREEAGIRRAFGATKWSVFLGFLREAWLLTTVSVVIGCIIYFQFAAARGLGDDYGTHNPAVHFWFDSFGTHFLVVSACVYLIILGTVLVATAIPAWRVSRSNIVEAIKEE